MIDPASSNVPQIIIEPPPATHPKKKNKTVFLTGTLLVIICLSLVYYCQSNSIAQLLSDIMSPRSNNRTAMALPTISETLFRTDNPQIAPPLIDKKIADLERNIEALDVKVTALNDEMQNLRATPEKTHKTSQTNPAAVIVFIQLQNKIASGHSFRNEYNNLVSVTREMPEKFQAQLRTLEPMADHETPTLIELHDRLRQLEPEAMYAVKRAEAKNWTDRIKAELQKIVSIHRLDTPGAFSDLDKSLASENFASIERSIEDQPEAARQLLSTWGQDVANRHNLDERLHELVNVLIALNNGSVSPMDTSP